MPQSRSEARDRRLEERSRLKTWSTWGGLRKPSSGRTCMMLRRSVARLDIPLELGPRDVCARPVLLGFDGAFLNSGVDLRPAHAKNSRRFDDLETQGWQRVRDRLNVCTSSCDHGMPPLGSCWGQTDSAIGVECDFQS